MLSRILVVSHVLYGHEDINQPISDKKAESCVKQILKEEKEVLRKYTFPLYYEIKR